MAKALLSLGLCALFSAACPEGAAVQTAGSVTLSQLRYDLVDLDLSDGVAPSLSWFLPPASEPSSTLVRGDPLGGAWAVIDRDTGEQAFADVSSSLAEGFGNGVASVNGGADWQIELQVNTSVTPGKDALNSFSAQALSGGLHFLLSPMTAVTFRTDVAVQGSTLEQLAPSDYSRTWLHAGIAVYPVPFYAGAPFWNALDWDASGGESVSDFGILALTVSNDSGFANDYRLTLNVSMDTLSQGAPVPEPSTWMLVLAGLALIGGAVRKQKTPALTPAFFNMQLQ